MSLWSGSAILFGLLHLNPWQFFHATILGVFFAWLFVKTDSLVPCILGHSLSNALPFTLKSILAWEIKGYTSDLSHHIQFQPLWFNLAGLVLTLVGLWFLSNRLGGSVPCRMTFYDK
ncbi:MAG: lysostaphin resistance A-like protein [bacterium]